MNPLSAPSSPTPAPTPIPRELPRPHPTPTVPRQAETPHEPPPLLVIAPDPLAHPDPCTAAQAAATENLLRCWTRENDLPTPPDGVLRIPLPASGTAVAVPVRYWSPSGWHRFGPPRLAGTPEHAPPADALTVAALLARQAGTADLGGGHADAAEEEREGAQAPGPPGTRTDRIVSSGGDRSLPVDGERPVTGVGGQALASGGDRIVSSGGDRTLSAGGGRTMPAGSHRTVPAAGSAAQHRADLVGRVADSLQRTALFLQYRRDHTADGPDRFLAAEQALLLGHPWHPAPKSSEGLTETEARHYSATGPTRLRSPLPARLLDSPVLRCKANLLTRLHGLDELVGPVGTQSVYVTIANPLHS